MECLLASLILKIFRVTRNALWWGSTLRLLNSQHHLWDWMILRKFHNSTFRLRRSLLRQPLDAWLLDCLPLYGFNGLHRRCAKVARMRELRTLAIVLVVSFLNGLIPVAFADEKTSPLQTALTATTVSGYVSTSADLPVPMDSGTLAPADMSASFSPSSVPEPSAISLFTVGIFAFAGSTRGIRCGCGRLVPTCPYKAIPPF